MMEARKRVCSVVVLLVVVGFMASQSFGGMTFLANYNDGLDATYAAGEGSVEYYNWDGNLQGLSADGDGMFASSSPNKGLENTADSSYGLNSFVRYDSAGNIDADCGTVAFWAKKTADASNGFTLTTFFAASNGKLIDDTQRLAIWTDNSNKNITARLGDGAGHFSDVSSLNYYNQMQIGDWTFIALSWAYDDVTGALDISFYTRDKKYVGNKSVVTGAVADWDTSSSGSSKFYVGTDFGAACSGANMVDQLAIFDNVLKESELDVMYADTVEMVPEPATISILGISMLGLVMRRKRS